MFRVSWNICTTEWYIIILHMKKEHTIYNIEQNRGTEVQQECNCARGIHYGNHIIFSFSLVDWFYIQSLKNLLMVELKLVYMILLSVHSGII